MNSEHFLHKGVPSPYRTYFGLIGVMGFFLFQISSHSQEIESAQLQQYLNHGQQAEERQLYQEALDWFSKASEINPQDLNIRLAIARQLIGLERLDETKQELNRIVEKDPKHTEAYTLLGIFSQKIEEDLSTAEKHYQAALRADPQAYRARYLLGELLLLLHRYDEAQTEFETLTKQQPQSPRGFYGWGNVLIKKNRYADAVEPLKKAVQLDPTEPEAYRLLGQALARSGNREESQKYLQFYQKVKKDWEKLAELRRIVRHNPGNAANWNALGYELFRQRMTGEAIEAFQRGIEINPNHSEILGLVGALYLQDKRVEKAQPYLREAIRQNPRNAEFYNNLGVCYMIQRNYPEAVIAFEQSLRLGDKNPNILKNLQIAKSKIQLSSPSAPQK